MTNDHNGQIPFHLLGAFDALGEKPPLLLDGELQPGVILPDEPESVVAQEMLRAQAVDYINGVPPGCLAYEDGTPVFMPHYQPKHLKRPKWR